MTPEAEPERATVSVIIPTRNRRELLLRALRSVLRQREVMLSVVVVDEASTDGSAEAVHRLGDPRVHVVRHESARGVSQARNTGLQQVESRWVAFLDDDDLWAPDKLSAQLEALRQQPQAQWACTGAVNVDSRCQVLNVSYPASEPDICGPLLAMNAVPGGGSGVLVATALARQVGGFDVALANLADWDFYIRLSLQSPVAAVQAPLVGYHVHTAGMAHDIERSSREIGYLDVKYADERQARGVRIDQGLWLQYLARLAYSGGQRWTSVNLALQSARSGRLRALRTVAGAFLPDRVHIATQRRALDQIPPDVLQQARRWLAPYAADGSQPG
jgi:glycosyltransferase involved in cell wall biosynthesis